MQFFIGAESTREADHGLFIPNVEMPNIGYNYKVEYTGDEDVVITDVCGRVLPIDTSSLKSMIDVLTNLYELSVNLNAAEELYEKIGSNDIRTFA